MARLRIFINGLASLISMGAVIFIIAGTLNLPFVWLYLIIRTLFAAASALAMSEAVARERLHPGPGVKPEPVYNVGTTIAWIAHILIVALDLGRFNWSRSFPSWLQVVGVFGMLVSFALVTWALRNNEYLSTMIRIQSERDHHVEDTGPYAYIRHPNYAGAFLMGLSSGLVFASWPSIIPMILFDGMLVYRTLNEEKVLFNELRGYREYADKVRYRFLPGIW
jgi:protein-S-isoprenylcysteine O-methyltransferase Ste14